MAFKGIVTTKDKEAGVVLEAKVVSPLKHKSAKKRFDITVKSNGISDIECCLIDAETLKNTLKNRFTLDELTSGIESGIVYTGANGTTITYEMTDSIRPYIGNNGVITKRPSLETGDISGSVDIVVKKNNEAVELSIPIVIKGYSFEEATSGITDSLIWDMIRGGNKSWSEKGYDKIDSMLAFNTNVSSSGLGISKFIDASTINVKYNVTDATGKNRIGTTGTLTTLDYSEAAGLLGMYQGVDVRFVNPLASFNSANMVVSVGGLNITVTLTINGQEVIKKFNCSTYSKGLNNKEVMEEIVIPQAALFTPDGTRINYVAQASIGQNTDTVYSIMASSMVSNTYIIKAYSNSGCETMTNNSLGITGTSTSTQITRVEFQNNINGSNGTDSIPLNVISKVFKGGFQSAAQYEELTIDFDALKECIDDGTITGNSYEFYVMTKISSEYYLPPTREYLGCKKFKIDMNGYV